jgi:hypothetical protein
VKSSYRKMFGFKRFTFFAVMQVTPFLPSSQFTLPFPSTHVLDAHFDFWRDGRMGGGVLQSVCCLQFCLCLQQRHRLFWAAMFPLQLLSSHAATGYRMEFPSGILLPRGSLCRSCCECDSEVFQTLTPFLFLCACHWKERNVSNLHRNVGTSDENSWLHATA